MPNNQKAKVMEKKMYAIEIVADGFISSTREGTGVSHRTRYCEQFLPFYGTREEATAAALGLVLGYKQQVKKFYDSGQITAKLDGERLCNIGF